METKFSFPVRFPFNPSNIRLEDIEIPECLNLPMLKKVQKGSSSISSNNNDDDNNNNILIINNEIEDEVYILLSSHISMCLH